MKTLVLSVWLATLALTGVASAVEVTNVEIAGKHATVCRVNLKKERLQLLLSDETGYPSSDLTSSLPGCTRMARSSSSLSARFQ